jgi:hypothetical protein
VKHAGGGTDVNQAMKHLPLLAAEPTDPFVRRGDCEGNEDNETQNTRNDEWTLCDVVHDRMKVEELIEPDVSDEMQKAVEKGEEPKHSAKPDKGLPSCDSSKRRDAQRNHHKTQCPDTGPVPQVFNGICAQLAGESIPRQPDRRHKTEQKDGRLEYPPTINFGDHRGKFIAVRPFRDLVHCICKRPVTKTAVRTPTETIASVEDQIDLTGGA